MIGDSFDALDPVIARARAQLEGRVDLALQLDRARRGGGRDAPLLPRIRARSRGRRALDGGGWGFAVLRAHQAPTQQPARRPGDGGALGEAERRVYRSTLADATGELAHLVRRGDIVFLHDPQTAGMVKPVHELGASVVWRCHVGVDRPNDLGAGSLGLPAPRAGRGRRAGLLAPELRLGRAGRTADLDHPPTIDAFSPKNQEMDAETVARCSGTIGLGPDGSLPPPTYRANDGAPARVNRKAMIVQEDLLPAETPLVAQVSRWDRLKDPVGLLACFAEHVDGPSLAPGHSGARRRGCRRRSRGRRSPR